MKTVARNQQFFGFRIPKHQKKLDKDIIVLLKMV